MSDSEEGEAPLNPSPALDKWRWLMVQIRCDVSVAALFQYTPNMPQPSYPAKPRQRPVQFWSCRVRATWLVACTLSLGLRCNWQLSAVSLCPVVSNGATDGHCGIWVKIKGESRCHWAAISFAGALVPCQRSGFVLSLIRLTQNSRSQLEHFSLGQHQWFFTGMLQPKNGLHVRCDRVVDSREKSKKLWLYVL